MHCRYCEQDGIIEREHIIPKFIYKYQKESGDRFIGWNERANDIIGGEATIADVCKTCNGGALSFLDDYGSQFLARNGFLTQLYLKTQTTITYDYHLLLRWLMKISYNSASAVNDPSTHIFGAYKDYILRGEPLPSEKDVMLFAGLLMPLKLTDEQKSELNISTSEDNLCSPFKMRITKNDPVLLRSGIILKGIFFGSIFFYLVITEKSALISKSYLKNKIIKNEKVKLINPSSSEMLLPNCGKNWITASEAQLKKEISNLGMEHIHKKLKI